MHTGRRYWLALSLVPLALVCFGLSSQNASAMGPAPGTCSNEYDGDYVSATIVAGNQTFYPLSNNVTFKMNIGQSYNLTTVIRVPMQSSQNNSNPGSLWYSSNEIGYDQNYCSPTVSPGTNYTISMNIGFPQDYNPGQSRAISVYWGAHNSYSYTVDWMTPSSAPSSPTNLHAATPSPSQISLSWTAPSSNGGSAITNYKIYRSTSSGSETLLATAGNATSYNDTAASSGTTYFYKVTAVNSGGESAQSNEANATLKVDQVMTTVYVGGQDQYGIAVNPSTNMIYSRDCCEYGSPLAVINGSTDSLQATISTSTDNGRVAVNPDTNLIYYSNGYGAPDSVSVVNGSTNSLVTNIPFSSPPGAIAVDTSTNKIYVTASDGVYVINGSTNAVVGKIGAGDGRAIAVNPDTNMIYVSNFGSNSTSVIDGSTNTIVKTIQVGWGPNDFAVNPITNKIFVADYWGGTVSVIDGDTNTVVSTINLGPVVIGAAVNPNTDKLYLSLGNGSVSVINDKSYWTLQNLPMNNGLGFIAADTARDRVYVAEYGGGAQHIPGNVVVIQGSSSYAITAPSAPQNLQAAGGDGQTSLTWAVPSSTGGSEIFYYNVYRGTTPNGEGSSKIGSALPPHVSYKDTGLTNGQTYYYKVTAVSHVGESALSNEASATPAATVTVSSAPQNLQATPTTPSQINLNWTAPANNGGSSITGYKIERSTDNGTNWSTVSSNTANTDTMYNDTNLSPGTTYTYRASAINSAGTSQPSNNASATMPSVRVGGNFAAWDWGYLIPEGYLYHPIGGDRQLQALIYAPNGNLVFNKTESANFSDSYFISRADGKGNYNITITYDKSLSANQLLPSWINDDPVIQFSTSENNDGSVSISGVVFHDLASEPVYIAIKNSTNSSLANFTSNTLAEGQISYEVGSSSAKNIFTKSGNYTIVITHIPTGVKAQHTLSYAMPATAPSSPQNLQATAVSSSQINLGWTAPSNNGGAPVTGYKIERSADNGTTWSTVQSNTGSTLTTYSDAGLAHSTAYTYRVSSINSIGTGMPSNKASATTMNAVPTPPAGLAAKPAITQINLSWTAPSDNGGTPVTGYKIERSTDSGTTWTVLVANTAGSGTTYSDSNVLPLTTYTYRVSAINSVGTSQPSNTASSTTMSGGSSTPTPGITLNNVQSTSGTTTSLNQMTLSSFNAGSGSNQLLLVGISANNQDATVVTFNGQPLTKAVSSFNNNAAQFWYLKNPSGTGNIVATFGGQTQAVVGAYSFANVDQTNPIPTTATNTNSASSSPSVSLTSKYANDWVLDLPSIYGGQKLGSPTCTQEWNTNIPSAITGASSSSIMPSPGSVTCKWTASNGGDLWDDVAVELKQA